MDSKERKESQKLLVEEFGLMFEKENYQPVAARILGLLIIMDKEEYTFEEIVDELQISKSSASNGIKNLEARGLVEYITRPGDRKKYFRFKIQETVSSIKDVMKRLSSMLGLINKITELKEDKETKNTVYLSTVKKNVSGIIDIISREIEK